jgi:hypothetical protein
MKVCKFPVVSGLPIRELLHLMDTRAFYRDLTVRGRDLLVNEIICDPQEQLASPPCCVLANHASNMHRADCG